jgi:hypothetical protein
MAAPDQDGVDATQDGALIEVENGVAGVRNVRAGLLQLASDLSEKPGEVRGYLVLPDTSITLERLRNEWVRCIPVIYSGLLNRMTLCVGKDDRFVGIPDELHENTQKLFAKYLSARGSGARRSRREAAFVVFKVLLHHWLTQGGGVTLKWLGDTAGYSYPTVASAIASLGSLIERRSDRRISLRWLPRDEIARMVAVSDSARGTARFVDRSSQPRTPEEHLRRLETMRLSQSLAIGGVLGAKHYLRELDLVGTPRLDLSQHGGGRHPDLRFIEKLDPALKRVDDPLEPATVVVHQIGHAESLFTPRDEGLNWADPVECLLDLYEIRLDVQASQFQKALERNRPKAPSR